MSSDSALNLVAQLLWTALLVAGPLLIASLLTGLIVSLFQVVTQLQEMSLSYVPKLIVVGLVIATMGSWMLGRLTGFTKTLFNLIPTLG
ncbi:flagellar biosynthesis protein FliQ [Burkholderia ubonensis]|uniref:Flagellar biosynthetic protein FliQ n=1 Tax=Burkholderia ubonensis TaxID=101571 RepID=A0A107ENH6_9BURK|nr:flagellar biosynthesis protein FliQ [Burkholderia ubonensis]KWD78388.1 flagellar biosynthetic protein FliQ [Burkholderia ubonensis]KWD87594.1 flagellar biosynthetic protein FliQ [Burkholderia ubonensis]KWD89737.1 flagellar biosynthetic protein FliQ [Burkholderia ubonensis]KWD96357.1 flagellar biosynthetic protein FliQ [Burkholderia ubonensis]